MMEEYTPGSESESEESQAGQLKQWFQDNLRIIVSIFIVVVIAGGIYSYSKRGNVPTTTEEPVATENQSEEGTVQIAGNSEEKSPETTKEAAVNKEEKKEESKPAVEAPKTESPKEEVSSSTASKETTDSFIEIAAKGNGTTHLARMALADYLEKNPDSSLTKEHKIYIEDYLRKNVGKSGNIAVGTQIEFSKDLIQRSIEQAKKLNNNQLKNLQKYSAQVSTL